MLRITMEKGADQAAADALKYRAEAMLSRFMVTEATIAKGVGELTLGGKRFDPYFVLSFDCPENCPVRKYVAYYENGELKTSALLKADRTIEDIEALERA